MTHTKGPWRYDGPNCAIVSETETRDFGDGDTFSTTVFTLYSACGGEDSQADIALACAAPDMLAALEFVYRVLTCENVHSPLVASELESIAELIARAKAVQS